MPSNMRFGRGKSLDTSKVRKHLRVQAVRVQARVEAFATAQKLTVEMVIAEEPPWCLNFTWRRKSGARISRKTEDAIRLFAKSLFGSDDNIFVFCPKISVLRPRPRSMYFVLQIDNMSPFVIKDPDPYDDRDPHFHIFRR